MPRGSEVQMSHKTSQKYLRNIQKSITGAFAFNHRHYAADNRTARDIQHFNKIQGGQCPPGPPDKNISAHRPLYACARSSKWSSTFLKIAPPAPNQPMPMKVTDKGHIQSASGDGVWQTRGGEGHDTQRAQNSMYTYYMDTKELGGGGLGGAVGIVWSTVDGQVVGPSLLPA